MCLKLAYLTVEGKERFTSIPPFFLYFHILSSLFLCRITAFDQRYRCASLSLKYFPWQSPDYPPILEDLKDWHDRRIFQYDLVLNKIFFATQQRRFAFCLVLRKLVGWQGRCVSFLGFP